MIKVVATDLDGTLLPTAKAVPTRTLAALAAVQALGAHVVPVTARSPRTTVPIMEEFGIEGFAVCGSGSLIYDAREGRIVERRPLDTSVASQIIEALRRAVPGVMFAAERDLHFFREPTFESPVVPMLETDALDIVADPVTKLIARHPDHLDGAFLNVVSSVAAGVSVDVTVAHSGGSWIEILATGVSKASALASLCERLGVVQHEVVAFGDLMIDVPMLEWAGLGVAMGNASAEVQAAADEVTSTNDAEGVAAMLERLLASNRFEAASAQFIRGSSG